MKKKTQKNTAKKSKTKTKPKKAISKFSYSMGKIILVILFVAVVALALYFILDGSLKLINKRHIYNEKSVGALVMAVEKNDYDKAVEIYEQLSEEDKISLHNNQSFLTAIENRFSDVLSYEYDSDKNDYKEENEYKFVQYFCRFLHPATVRENVYYFFNTFKLYNSPPYENFKNFIGILNELLKDGNFEEQINLYNNEAEIIRESREQYFKGKVYEEQQDYNNAYLCYANVVIEDTYAYELAKEDIARIKGLMAKEILDQAKTFESEGDIENAYYTIKSAPDLLSDVPEIVEYKEYITNLYQRANYVPYTGVVYNIFFHSLALYPDIAFSSSRGRELFDIMTTRYEFRKTLEKLYEHGFILINVTDIYEIYIKDGKEHLKIKEQLLLPEGKKPLIMSFDNMACTHASVGFCKMLTLDDNNNLASIVTIDGVDTLTYDGEHVLILYDFVKKHPDFSYNNAMAVIGMSGYESMFGYATADLNSPSRQSELNKAKSVADKLKEMGYVFANHSYYHYTKSSDIPDTYTDLQWITYDTNLWKEHIEPILGKTNIYITPGGKNYSVAKYIDGDRTDPCYNYLVDAGYQIILSVGRGQFYANNVIGVANPRFFFGTSLFMDRYNIDGKSFYKTDVVLEQVFGFPYSDIIDPIREKYKQSY